MQDRDIPFKTFLLPHCVSCLFMATLILSVAMSLLLAAALFYIFVCSNMPVIESGPIRLKLTFQKEISMFGSFY